MDNLEKYELTSLTYPHSSSIIDFFGINEVYNTPGTSGDPNWTLRLPDNFEEFYLQKVQSGDALNLPLALIYAIKARGRDFAGQNHELIERLEKLV